MSILLTITLEDDLQQTILTHATQINLTLEDLILQTLRQQFPNVTAPSPEAQELLNLIGTLDLGTTDLGENHDRYIGEALYRELRHVE